MAELLADKPRHRKLLDLAAEKAGWELPVGEGRGRGISLQESFGTLVAQVVEVTVDQEMCLPDRVVLAVDPGLLCSRRSHRSDGVRCYLWSSAAMYGEINIEKGRVSQSASRTIPWYGCMMHPRLKLIVTW